MTDYFLFVVMLFLSCCIAITSLKMDSLVSKMDTCSWSLALLQSLFLSLTLNLSKMDIGDFRQQTPEKCAFDCYFFKV